MAWLFRRRAVAIEIHIHRDEGVLPAYQLSRVRFDYVQLAVAKVVVSEASNLVDPFGRLGCAGVAYADAAAAPAEKVTTPVEAGTQQVSVSVSIAWTIAE